VDPALAILGERALLHRALPAEPGVWDEMRLADGGLRPAWRRFAATLPGAGIPGGEAGSAAFDRKLAQLAAQLQRDGVTHNVVGHAVGDAAAEQGAAARPWSLELLPQLIDAADWVHIEAGVAQRAELIEAVLADCAGPRTLLAEGLLPGELLFRHPGWLRGLAGHRPAGGRHLYVAAFDLARGPDGLWWLVAQRTQGPSGLGYVLHNRLLVARQFPEAFQALGVQPVADAVRSMVDALEVAAAELARRAGHGTPRLVLLTPGPYSETYFEHVYLARELGLTLVEGGDLTVRGERLFLQTVEGLEPVHGVLRRLDDDWCDPLELRPKSGLGVPGLMQAVRAGTVVMANALGSAFVESPALQGFLPGIAERLLGSPLALPSLPTWWCGEAAAWADAKTRLAGKVVRSTFPRDGRTSQVHAGQEAEIDADPGAWTVQGRLRFSRAPIRSGGVLVARPAMLRVYAIVGRDGRWQVLPGGMTRVAQREDASVSMQRGGSSLDTWVLAEPGSPRRTSVPAPRPRLEWADIHRRRWLVASRTGENLFWLGRYTERCEQQLRLARATLAWLVSGDGSGDDGPDPSGPGAAEVGPAPSVNRRLEPALSQLAWLQSLVPANASAPALARSPALFRRTVLAAMGDAKGGSLARTLKSLESLALALRERMSDEQWLLLRRMRGDLLEALRPPAGAAASEGFALDDDGLLDEPAAAASAEGEAVDDPVPTPERALAAMDTLAWQLAAVTGTQTDRMTRDHGWRLLATGRLIERLIGAAQTLRALLDPASPGAVAGGAAGTELLLALFDSQITFRARYQRHDDPLALTELLVLDSTNPRSLAGALRRLRTELSKLPQVEGEPLAALLPAQGAGLGPEELDDARSDAELAQMLLALAEALAQRAAALSDRLGERYFTPAHGSAQSV
jgi:uncharacterized circularly permuted ATP-grasp superfamily protein/uncharacterized alpha-E superfamily protein